MTEYDEYKPILDKKTMTWCGRRNVKFYRDRIEIYFGKTLDMLITHDNICSMKYRVAAADGCFKEFLYMLLGREYIPNQLVINLLEPVPSKFSYGYYSAIKEVGLFGVPLSLDEVELLSEQFWGEIEIKK